MSNLQVPELKELPSVVQGPLVSFLRSLLRLVEQPGPKSVQLEHKTTKAKATVNGMLMFDPVSKQAVISIDGAWYALEIGDEVTTGILVP